MSEKNRVLVLDFGGQYNLLIARRVRECGVYCEIKPNTASIEEIRQFDPAGIIFTGGPSTVYEEDAPRCAPEVFALGVPVLGICYGQQLMTVMHGGSCKAGEVREYGKAELLHNSSSQLFEGVRQQSVCWMSHTISVDKLPEGFVVCAKTKDCPTAAIENPEKRLYGMQFHPEVMHTEQGALMLQNFLYKICGLSNEWTMAAYSQQAVADIRQKVGNGKVLLALSGGVDSSVAAALISKAVGSQLTCVFVDHGLLRKDEGDLVEQAMKSKFDMNIVRVNAQERFLEKLAGVADPERKRKIIGEEFIRVFEEESKKIGAVDFLAQGTIYPDVVESGLGKSAVIKSHHNVGGLPDYVDFKEIIEPLRLLFKDEVRALGLELGLPEELVWRQPFPGPGLAVRIIGDITAEKIAILQEADAIFRQEIANAKLDREINQYFAVLTDMRSVGVMGDGRTYDYTVALRGVVTSDFMTADWARIPYDVLEKTSNRIVNEAPHINRVVYDITSKPPATIEWE